MMSNDPVWLGVTYLYGIARRRIHAARSGNPESGALTLEWIIIAAVLVAAAGLAGIWFDKKITSYENKAG